MKRNETSTRIKEIMSSLLYYLSYWYSRTNWECNIHACLLIDLQFDLHATIHCYVFACQLLCSQLQECKNIYVRNHICPTNEIENIESVEEQYVCISTNRSIYFINMEPRGISTWSIEKLISTLSFNRLRAIFMCNEIWSNIRDYETQMTQLRRSLIRGK